MPIQPIDIQNLLLRLEQINKTQANYQSNIAHQQTVAGDRIASHSSRADHRVSETDITDEGPDPLKTDDNDRRQSSEDSPKNSDKKDDPEIFRDPDIGNTINLEG